MVTNLCILVMALVSLLLGGCCKPLLYYSLDTPSLILTPVSLAHVAVIINLTQGTSVSS
jgi:hypothetical protein